MDTVSAALVVIRDVTTTAEDVCVNKHQCKRLAERFRDVGRALEASKFDASTNAAAMDQILAVAKKGAALVREYASERRAFQNVLYRADNFEAFREVHEEVDALGTFLDLGGAEEAAMLSSDADADRGEIVGRAHTLVVNDISEDRGSLVENMEKAVTEKCLNADGEDLSYLNIPISAIRLEGAVKELKPLSERESQADAHLDGKALVHTGKWNGCCCAVKVFKSIDVHWNTVELRKEIASLVKLRHPHVTQLIGCAQHETRTYVLYELMDSDLRFLIEARMKKKLLPGILQDGRPFSRAKEVSIMTQIARGMFYLHEKGFVHGELKCTNVLVKVLGDHVDVKVADFHCSRQLGQTPTTKYSPAHRPRWMPPEAFQHFNVDQPSDELLMKGDVYSFAMTCYEVVTGNYPFDGVRGNLLNEKIQAGERPDLPKDLSTDLKRLITKCWHQDPEQRPSFQDICYVLKVASVNLISPIENLFSRCLGICNPEPVANVSESRSWSDFFGVPNELNTASIDDAARTLPHYLKIRPSDLRPERLLSQGASAQVFEANWIGCRFAVKWLKVDHVAKLQQEVRIMMKLLHPHVVRLVGFSVLFNRCAIVMELLDMSVRDWMDSRIKASKEKHHPPLTEPEALGIITKIALGMQFLHSKGVIHGDLKGGNVLVCGTNSKTTKLEVKIADFGLSQVLECSPYKRSATLGWWRAPEIIKCERDIDLKAADVYSFAMVCYEVVTGKIPFQGLHYDTAKALAEGGGGENLDTVNMRPKLKCLLKECWSQPEHRPKFDNILERLAQLSI